MGDDHDQERRDREAATMGRLGRGGLDIRSRWRTGTGRGALGFFGHPPPRRHSRALEVVRVRIRMRRDAEPVTFDVDSRRQ